VARGSREKARARRRAGAVDGPVRPRSFALKNRRFGGTLRRGEPL